MSKATYSFILLLKHLRRRCCIYLTQILDFIYLLLFLETRVPLSGKSLKLTFQPVYFSNTSTNNQKQTVIIARKSNYVLYEKKIGGCFHDHLARMKIENVIYNTYTINFFGRLLNVHYQRPSCRHFDY